jgi:hypothetical protein
MSQSKPISRRAALARLGLTAASAYISPGILGISMAHAASSVSSPTPPSPATPPSAPSQVSPPTGASQPEGRSRTSDQSDTGSCNQTALPDVGNITRQDYERAQHAIQRGDARPLREVIQNVQSEHPGKFLRVGYFESGRSPNFKVVIVNPSGAIVSVTVDAKSGQITNVQNC